MLRNDEEAKAFVQEIADYRGWIWVLASCMHGSAVIDEDIDCINLDEAKRIVSNICSDVQVPDKPLEE